jgi:DNA-binding CsgD family transcriptional regulator
MGSRRSPTEIVRSGNTWTVGHLALESDVRDAFERLAESYAFHGFAVFALPSRIASSMGKQVLMTNWPGEIFRQYDAKGLIKISPVFERMRQSTVPFTVDNERIAASRTEGRSGAGGLFLDAGFSRVLFIPVHDAAGRRSAIALGGNRPDVSRKEMNVLTFVAGHLYNRLSEIWAASRRTPGALSRREIECLRLAATGKTTTEMARILSLSEYTVNHYLNRATRKLDSVNRVQTIAKAIRAGLIL